MNTHRHVGQPACRVQSRGNGETEILGGHCAQVATRNLRQGPDTRTRQSGSHAPKALVNQDSVVEVQRHDIGDGTQGHQIEPIRKSGGGQASPHEKSVFRQEGSDSAQHVVDDADSSKRLATELAP